MQEVTAGLIGLGLALSLAACGESNDARQGPAPAAIKAVVLPFLTAAPFYIAAEEGYFEEQNLEVEFVKLVRNVDAIPALARGEVDVGAGQLTITVLNAMASGARIRLVAGTGYLDPGGCTFQGIVAGREAVDSGRLSGPEQLVGLTVDLDELLPTAYYVDRLLQPAGFSIDDLDIVNVPTPANVEAVMNATIDVTFVSEPYVSRIERSGEAVVWRGFQDIVPDYQVSSVMFGPNLLDERPEVGERFMVAFRKGMQQYGLGKTPRNLEILSRGIGLPIEELREMCWASFRKDGRVGTEGLMDYQRWLESRGLLDHVTPTNELVEPRFVDHANAVVNP